MIQEALVAHLLAQSTVTAITGTRIYPVLAQRDTNGTYLTTQNISRTPDNHAQGPGIVDARYQIDIYGVTYLDVAALGEEGGIIETVLDGFRGDMQGVEMLYIGLQNTQDLHNATAERFRISKDFRLRARI